MSAKFSGWMPIASTPPAMREMITYNVYQKGPLKVILSIEDHGGKIVRHVSVSCKDRYPTWDEIKEVRYTFMEDKHEAIMIFPPKDEYVNLHNNTFHLWAKANGSRWE